MRFWCFALLLIASSGAASDKRDVHEFKSAERVVIRADRSYILFRAVRPNGAMTVEPVLLRLIPPDEAGSPKDQIERNSEVYNLDHVDAGRVFEKNEDEVTYFAEVKPGTYVIYGLSIGVTFKPALHTCLCLGTVGFRTKAGEVTDLGFWFADRVGAKSRLPELAGSTGMGKSAAAGFVDTLTATVRPVSPAASLPGVLANSLVRPAEYFAVGRFIDARSMGINRLGAVPGILDYRAGRVWDVKTSSFVNDNF